MRRLLQVSHLLRLLHLTYKLYPRGDNPAYFKSFPANMLKPRLQKSIHGLSLLEFKGIKLDNFTYLTKYAAFSSFSFINTMEFSLFQKLPPFYSLECP